MTDSGRAAAAKLREAMGLAQRAAKAEAEHVALDERMLSPEMDFEARSLAMSGIANTLHEATVMAVGAGEKLSLRHLKAAWSGLNHYGE